MQFRHMAPLHTKLCIFINSTVLRDAVLCVASASALQGLRSPLSLHVHRQTHGSVPHARIQEELGRLGWELPTDQEGLPEQQYSLLTCPRCGGGDKRELSASLKLEEREGGWAAVWHCFRHNNCGESGRVPAGQVRNAPSTLLVVLDDNGSRWLSM